MDFMKCTVTFIKIINVYINILFVFTVYIFLSVFVMEKFRVLIDLFTLNKSLHTQIII